MDWIIWIGAAISVVGLAVLVRSIVMVASARKNLTGDAEIRDAIQKAIPYNMGGFLLSVLGLMIVAAGIWLG